jgi:hypothetical protein
MAKVITVYNTLKGLANKDQRGFITPEAFNDFAPMAQMTIYNRLFNDLVDAAKSNRAGIDPARDKSLGKRVKESLSVFQRNATITRQDGIFNYPENFSRAISATTFGSVVLGQSNKTPIEILYDEDKISRILQSRISRPSLTFPVALMSETIEVYPQSINRIILSYYKRPQGRDAVDGSPVSTQPSIAFSNGFPNITDSVDFELPDNMTEDIVLEMAILMGIKLKDSDVYQFSSGEKRERDIDQSQ